MTSSCVNFPHDSEILLVGGRVFLLSFLKGSLHVKNVVLFRVGLIYFSPFPIVIVTKGNMYGHCNMLAARRSAPSAGTPCSGIPLRPSRGMEGPRKLAPGMLLRSGMTRL
jgi:hypothetical protein